MIVRGNALSIPLPDNSVHCVVTSPPYWGLRKYAGEQDTAWPDGSVCGFGLEPTIEQYVDHSILILLEVRRMLRDDGVCWWNLGDSYSAGGRVDHGTRQGYKQESNAGSCVDFRVPDSPGVKPLDLCLIPERVALAAQADGWYVRSLVIWAKPNRMPESVNGWRWERHRVKVAPMSKDDPRYRAGMSEHNSAPSCNVPCSTQWADCHGCPKCSPNDGLVLRKGSWRPTDAYEHILMLAKSADYFGDAEAVKEASEGSANRASFQGNGSYTQGRSFYNSIPVRPDDTGQRGESSTSRNLRNVWTFPTQPYPEAHFATFPERLPEICIKASTSEKGCCPKCGANWVRVIDRQQFGKAHSDTKFDATMQGGPLSASRQAYREAGLEGPPAPETIGWRPSCSCNAGEPVPCTVLDPFGGSGTTARVATELGRRAVSLDLAYHGLASRRTTEIQPWMIFA